MAIQGVNSQTRPIQQPQTHQTAFAQPPVQQKQQQDPLAALTKALEALEQAVSALTSKGFNNNQSVAQQATQNLGTSGQSQSNPFDFSQLFGGGSSFDTGSKQQPQPQQQVFTPPVYNPPVQQSGGNGNGHNDYLGTKGGGNGHVTHIENGDKKAGGGGGVRVDSGGANN